MIKILVVDGCYLMRMGLVGLLSRVPDFVVSGAGDGEGAIQIASEQSFDVVVTDLCLPDTEGSELVSSLLFYCPTVKAIALTAYFSRDSLNRFLEAGGLGYLTKNISLEKLVYAIRTVANGERYFDREATRFLDLRTLSTTQPTLESLSLREKEILKMITEGMGVSEIAQSLRISPKIVNLHRYQLYHKLCVQNDVELAMVGMKMGILEGRFTTKSSKRAEILHLSLVPKTEPSEKQTEEQTAQ